MSNNMYRLGDYVYFETSSTSPYQIRRIEELNKTQGGNVEAKVMCFFRRRDISPSLIPFADKHQSGALEEEDTSDGEGSAAGHGSSAAATAPGEDKPIPFDDRHQLRHRELFLSRQIETLPVTHIRGKCTVTLLNETETLSSYLNKEDMFFYSLVYDPQQKTLLADKGEIRVGSRYQADMTSLTKELGPASDTRVSEELETLGWTPHHDLTDRQIDQFLVISRSVGTFARALDCSSSMKQPSLHMSAAAASRDVTLFHAMDSLHISKYDMSTGVCSLVPSSGPVLCRDEMEEWSASEANLFEEALDKYGKDFNDIRQDFLPWKTLKNIIEYYYMWKTTDRYVQQKRVKAVEAESKLRQVYIPNYNKPNPAALTNGKNAMVNGNATDSAATPKPCESCQCTSSPQWYAWGSAQMQCRLCTPCWNYWKKFGGLRHPSKMAREEERSHIGGGRVHRCTMGGCGREFKTRSQLMRHAAQTHGITLRPGSPKPVMKTRNAFCLQTSLTTRLMRRLCPDMINPRKASRNPTWPIYATNIRTESSQRLGSRTFDDLMHLVKRGPGKRKGKVADVSVRLGRVDKICPQWLLLPGQRSPVANPQHIAYPKPPKASDGSLIYTPVPNKQLPLLNTNPSSLLKRKAYEDTNGMDGPPTKKQAKEPIVAPTSTTPPVGSEALDTYRLNQLGVNPPPGLTVTPVGGATVNGGVPPSGPEKPTPPPPIAPSYFSNAAGAFQHVSGRARIATVSRIAGRPRVISWMDAPDDVYFYATDSTKKLRKTITAMDLKRAARRPWRKASQANTVE